MQGNCIGFPQVYDGHMQTLFSSPHLVKEYVQVQLLSPSGNFDPLREHLLGSGDFRVCPRVMLVWLQLFYVGNPELWGVPLAGLCIDPASLRALEGVTAQLLAEVIEDSSDISHLAVAESDIAGVREQLPLDCGAESGGGPGVDVDVEESDGAAPSGGSLTAARSGGSLTADFVFLDSGGRGGHTAQLVRTAMEAVLDTIQDPSPAADAGAASGGGVLPEFSPGTVPVSAPSISTASSTSSRRAAFIQRLRDKEPVCSYDAYGRNTHSFSHLPSYPTLPFPIPRSDLRREYIERETLRAAKTYDDMYFKKFCSALQYQRDMYAQQCLSTSLSRSGQLHSSSSSSSGSGGATAGMKRHFGSI